MSDPEERDADYSQMKQEEFDDILITMVRNRDIDVMSVPGVWELVAEECNNEILDRWADLNSEKAYPTETEDA